MFCYCPGIAIQKIVVDTDCALVTISSNDIVVTTKPCVATNQILGGNTRSIADTTIALEAAVLIS